MFFIQASLLVTVAVFSAWGYHVNLEDVGISEGKPIPVKNVPFMVSVRVGTRIECGGSIIDEQFILTTAHCVTQEPAEYTIHTKTNKRHEKGDVYEVEKIIKHEKFSLASYDYDIALVKLATNIEFSRYVKTIKLPATNEMLPEYLDLTVFGWGENQFGELSNYLLKVSVPVMPKLECKKTYENVTTRMICTGMRYHGFCTGDSGGPAIYGKTQLGIAAYSLMPCSLYPQIYTYLPPLRKWIDENMAKNR